VSNLRQKLVCGSPLLAPRMRYYEWYSRALVPGTHFVQVEGLVVPDDSLAQSVNGLHEWMANVACWNQQAVTTAFNAVISCRVPTVSPRLCAPGTGGGRR
jgi:hypothetical protein